MTPRVFRCTPLLLSAILLAPTRGFADATKDQCVDADANAQPLRRDGKLGAAREQLQVCLDVRCPGIVRDDCAQRLDELERAQPTVVFDAKDAEGNDVSAVRVTVDGHPLVDKLDGTALRVDPGDHEFAFEIAGQQTATRRLVLHEGEKGRHERVVLGAARQGPTPASVVALPSSSLSPRDDTARPPPAPPATQSGSGRRTLELLLAGAGAAGVAVGGVFGVLTILNSNQSKSDCSNPPTPANCPRYSDAVSSHDSAIADGTISTVAFIAGGALLTGWLALWLTAPSDRASTAKVTYVRIVPTVDREEAGIAVKGAF